MKYIGSLDQGTTSTRFMIFSSDGETVSMAQKEHEQICPKPGWVEHNPDEIWANTKQVMSEALSKAGLSESDLHAIGITNQRETIIPFSRKTGRTYYNAIVWQDLRGIEYLDKLRKILSEEEIRRRTGLLYSPYFSASKIMWLIDNVREIKELSGSDDLVFGTIDSYILYKLSGGEVMTDVTNASRYMAMNISKTEWDEGLLEILGISRKNLPTIVPSFGRVLGRTKSGVPIAGILGDQQAALFGEACFSRGESKCTFGTGIFMLASTGEEKCVSTHGLITTVAYKEEGRKPRYALEGSAAIGGALIQWVRDELGIIESAKELDSLAASVRDTGGVYIVPAFSGLFAPYWREEARGIIAGLTGYVSKKHICRAVLEAIAFQSEDLRRAMEDDGGIKLEFLRADGGVTNSEPFMRILADIMGIPVTRPKISETTCLGAAYAAGLTTGIWESMEELKSYIKEDYTVYPENDDKDRAKRVRFWKKAVERTFDWADGEN